MDLMTKKQICELFNLSPKTIEKYQREGLPVERKSGRGIPSLYDATKVHKWLMERQADISGPETNERKRLDKLRGDKIDLEIKLKNGELILSEDAVRIWGTIVQKIKARLMAIPTKAAPLILGVKSIAEGKDILQRLINETLKDLSNPALGNTKPKKKIKN